MSRESYESCLENAYKVNWRIEEVVGDREFDASRRWLPAALSAADHLPFLTEEERRRLTHVEMAAYAHLFGYVEAFVAPLALDLAHDVEFEQRTAFDALTHFASEEVKHMTLFRRIRDRIDASLGFGLELLGGEEETARFVLGKSRGAVLLLTACIEWLTQRHHLECFQTDDDLDPLTRHVFRCHWLEESQHARLDELETRRAFAAMSAQEKDRAVDELVELVGAVDGLLRQQARLDVANFRRTTDRALDGAELALLEEEVLRAKRHTFLVSGVTHPRFVALLEEVTTPAQLARVHAALGGLLPVLAAA